MKDLLHYKIDTTLFKALLVNPLYNNIQLYAALLSDKHYKNVQNDYKSLI